MGRHRAALALAAVLGALVLVGWGLGELVGHVLAGPDAARIDRPVLEWLGRERTPWLTTAARTLTHLGGSAVVVPVAAVVGGTLWWQRRSARYLLFLLCTYAGAQVLFRSVKALVERPRPPAALAVGHFSGFAFPSGHATLATAMWCGFAVVWAHGRGRRARVAVWLAAPSVAATVGLTRLYLGAHWLTDVLGGSVLAAAWLAAAAAAFGLRRAPDALSDSR